MVPTLKGILASAAKTRSIEEVNNMIGPMKSFCVMLEKYRFIKKSHYSEIKA